MNAHALGLRALGALALAAAVAAPAQAYLGSFENNDGYHVQSGFFGGDVTYYNSGAYGPNAGGGSGPTQIVADSGLWDLLSPVGGYFTTAADRTAAAGAGPPYPANPPNTAAAYIVGNHFGGHLGGTCLALRNDTPGGTGPMVYDYDLDTFDFGGPAPASITSGILPVQWWFCPNPGDTPNPGTKTGDKFTLSFRDSLGNVGFQWGYDRANAVYWRTSSSNPWTPTAIVADQTNWDSVKVNIDLTADTFGIDYYDISTNTTSTMVPAGTALGMPMTNLTSLQWQLEDNLSAGVGGKNFFDDFHFATTVPEPASLALVALLVPALVRFGRSRAVE